MDHMGRIVIYKSIKLVMWIMDLPRLMTPVFGQQVTNHLPGADRTTNIHGNRSPAWGQNFQIDSPQHGFEAVISWNIHHVLPLKSPTCSCKHTMDHGAYYDYLISEMFHSICSTMGGFHIPIQMNHPI